jgi:hypothetical protein
MDLTPENKARIDGMSYHALFEHWRNAPMGDKWFQGATGNYWAQRMKELRAKPGGDELHTACSKDIGWGGRG